MNDIVRYTGNSEIANDSDDHKDEIGRISGRKKCVAVGSNLVQVLLQHVLLYLSHDAPKNIGHGQP